MKAFLQHKFRIILLTALIVLGTGILAARLYDYQIVRQDEFLALVPQPKEVLLREPGIRGQITDRNGIVLANNQRNYEITLNLEEVYHSYKEHRKNLPTSEQQNLSNINAIVNQFVRPKLAVYDLDRKEKNIPGIVAHFNTHAGLIPFVFRDDLSYDEFAFAAEHNVNLPGVYISVRPRRYYPYGALASHVIGYVNQWNKGNIPEDFKHYIGDSEGVSGSEKSLNAFLQGTEGVTGILRSPKGQTIAIEEKTTPSEGADIQLTIDAEIQFLTEKVIRLAGRAAAVVIDPHSGDILAMASTPDYNPNDFIPSLTRSKQQFYYQNKASPFTNGAIQNFTPGSTFKLPTALSACLRGHIAHTHDCQGFISYGKLKCKCWKTEGHGALDMQTAIQQSCNPYFMSLAAKIGGENIAKDFELFGLGNKTGIRLPSESGGIIPGSDSWKLRDLRNRLTPAIIGMTSIGQSDSECTPLQMASLVGAIANRGHLYAPRILKNIDHPQQNIVFPNKPKLKLNLLRAGASSEDLETIRLGMWLAANEQGGTARNTALDTIEVAAKTGTAQTTDFGEPSNISWTVAFAPYQQPRYVVAVAVRRGTSGGLVAAPLVKLILEGMFARDNGYKIPLSPLPPAQGHFKTITSILLPEENRLQALFSPQPEQPQIQTIFQQSEYFKPNSFNQD